MSAAKGPALLVAGGPLEGQAIALRGSTGEHVLGSAPTAALRLEAGNVEAAHAWVTWDERGVFVNDAGTQTGTFVNGERVEQERELADGDRVSLGRPGDPASVKLLVYLPGHPSGYPPDEAEPVAARAIVAVPDVAPSVAPEAAPAAGPTEEAKTAAASDKWGAVDDDDEVIKTAPPSAPKPAAKPPAPAPPKPAPAQTTAHTTAHAPAHPPGPAAVAARGRTQPVPLVPRRSHRRTARPPVSRALLVGVGAALLASLGFLWYSRSQAPAPVLATLLPPKAEPGQTIQINGSGFEAKAEGNAVSFGDKRAEVIAAGEQQLSVVVPQGLPADGKSEHRVRVRARGAISNSLFFRVYSGPRVTSVEPDVAMPGDEVKATGENFGEDVVIQVGGAAAEVIEVQPTALRFRVPKLQAAPGKSVQVSVLVGKNAARPATLLIGRLPLVLEVSPERGLPGDRVTVKGRGFDPAPGGNAVAFGGRAALVLSASERELLVAVPGAGQLTASELPISVRARGSASTGTLVFRLARVSTAVFVPRFFPEPGPNPETVFVSSDLGPFLRLRGKADAPSAAERGARAAAALNAALEQAAREPVTIELRDRPEHAVALAGGGPPLLVAKAEDGAAYEGARPSARALARYWAALLQDYVALFVQKQRPLRVLELSPRGQALLELYAAAERRAGVGSGVPTSVVENLVPSQARALAEMALSVPVESQAVSGAAVAGRWEGTLEEIGQPTRAIQVRIRAAASLSGSLTRRSGGISGEVPLQDAAYKDGVLRFVVKMGTVPMHFQGKVEGRSIAGEVQADGKPRGSFSIRWVE